MCAFPEEVFSKLEQNNSDNFEETTRLLIKIADNVLKNPSNANVRTLQKNNKTVKTKILEVPGGKESLLLMGFIEKDGCFNLPEKTPLSSLHQFKTNIEKLQKHVKEKKENSENAFAALRDDSLPGGSDSKSIEDSDSSSSDEEPLRNSVKKPEIPIDIPLVTLPPLTYIFSNPFLQHIENRFHAALAYKDKDLIEKAKNLIPIRILEENAQRRLRHLQEQVKKGKTDDPEISMQEMMILELLSWFKNDFFSWVDTPECDFCDGNTSFGGMSSNPSHLIHTNRVEIYKCSSCQNDTLFPRYNDVNILLITRRGRCGEWANTFTLLCTAMGWDARFIEDQTDHVWTEVYSFAQKRWLHCDPCENVCDTPLMYEAGWKKQVSYIIGYSPEEVQDVTWRYTSNHKDALKRRNKCSEDELVSALIKLRELRQRNFSEARKEYLTKRVLVELVELMKERKPNESDKEGRTSGSLQWRLARGEIQTQFVPYLWVINEEECKDGSVTIQYSSANDKYEKRNSSKTKFTLDKWSSGVLECENVFRKEESDWKMVYLARNEGTNSGRICWKFQLNTKEMVLDGVEVTFVRKTFENGNIDVQICSEDVCVNFPKDQMLFKTRELNGAKELFIKAVLAGGKGDVAWQHTQLFRQEMNSKEFPFVITLKFKSKCQRTL